MAVLQGLYLQPRSPARSGNNIEKRQTSMAWRVLEKLMIYLLEIQNLKISSKIISSHFFHLSIPVMGRITSSQNSYVEVLIPSASECDCIGDRIIKAAIKVIWVDPNPIWPMSLQEEDITTNVKTERRWPSTGQREGVSQKIPILSTHRSWTASLQNCEEINSVVSATASVVFVTAVLKN